MPSPVLGNNCVVGNKPNVATTASGVAMIPSSRVGGIFIRNPDCPPIQFYRSVLSEMENMFKYIIKKSITINWLKVSS
jgi:hypothetical protein